MCVLHLQRFNTGVPLNKPIPDYGNGNITSQGYWEMYRNGQRHLEHRCIMEKHIGLAVKEGLKKMNGESEMFSKYAKNNV